MRAQGWPDSGSVSGGHWQGRGRINSERRKGTGWGKTAQPSPAQPPRALGPGPERCLLRSWVVQEGGQAGRQALQIRHAREPGRFGTPRTAGTVMADRADCNAPGALRY